MFQTIPYNQISSISSLLDRQLHFYQLQLLWVRMFFKIDWILLRFLHTRFWTSTAGCRHWLLIDMCLFPLLVQSMSFPSLVLNQMAHPLLNLLVCHLLAVYHCQCCDSWIPSVVSQSYDETHAALAGDVYLRTPRRPTTTQGTTCVR